MPDLNYLMLHHLGFGLGDDDTRPVSATASAAKKSVRDDDREHSVDNKENRDVQKMFGRPQTFFGRPKNFWTSKFFLDVQKIFWTSKIFSNDFLDVQKKFERPKKNLDVQFLF